MVYSIIWMWSVCDCVCKIIKNNCDFGGQQYLNRLVGSDLVFLVIKQIHSSVISEKLPTAEVLCREMKNQASLVIHVFCVYCRCVWVSVCAFGGQENTALNIPVHLFMASHLEQYLLAQLWDGSSGCCRLSCLLSLITVSSCAAAEHHTAVWNIL